MHRLNASLLSAAVSGILLGSTGCSAETKTDPKATTGTPAAVAEKHACAKMNSCEGKGGCATGDKGCKAKNTCKTKGGCATVAHHTCAKLNDCSKQGGCKTGDAGCAGKNTCSKKGGCAVPVKH